MNKQYDAFELMDCFEKSSLTSFELNDHAFSLKLKREIIKLSSEEESQRIPISEARNTVVEEPVKEKGLAKAVISPLVGVVYLQASPDEPPFKQVGDQVAVGEVICIVEAMKVMNEIVSDIAGTVTDVLVANEEVVAFNQPLIRVEEG